MTTLLDLAAQLRRASQAEQELRVLSQASDLARSADLARTRVAVDLLRVQTLRTLDRADEAHTLLLTIPKPSKRDDAALQCSYYRQSGNFYAFIGNEAAATESFETAKEIAETRKPDELIITLTSYGISLWRLGRIEGALGCFERALKRALKERQKWRLPRLYSLNAQALLTTARYSDAREYLMRLKRFGFQEISVATWFTSTAIPLALRIGDDNLIACCGTPALLEDARKSGNPTTISQLSAAFGMLEASRGNPAGARSILSHSLQYVKLFAWNWDFLIAVAGYGSKSDAAVARALFAERSRFRHNDVPNATLTLFDAIVSYRSGRLREAIDTADRAARRFSSLGWYAYAEDAKRICNDSSDYPTWSAVDGAAPYGDKRGRSAGETFSGELSNI